MLQDFSRVSGKQEPPSGLASQQLSRLPSDEHICLSPPWNEEDDGPVRVGTLNLQYNPNTCLHGTCTIWMVLYMYVHV